MQHTQIILRSFLPPDQDSTKSVHPTVCSLHDPASGFEACRSLESLCFFAPRTKVECIMKLGGQCSNFVIVIPFVQTQTLRFRWCRSGSFDRNTHQSFAGQLEVIDVGSGDGQSHGNARCVGQQTALRSALGPIRGVFPGFFPHPREPWSSHRPSIAISIRFPLARRTPSNPSPTTVGRHRLRSTLETFGAPTN